MIRSAGTTDSSMVCRRARLVGLAVLVAAAGLTCPLGVNTPPVASDLNVTTSVNTPVEITLVATDADGDPLTFSIATGPVYGSLSDIVGDRVTYTPDADYVGPDSFTYTAFDGIDTSDPATVSITVEPEDAPPADTVIDTDTTMTTFTVAEGTVAEIRNNARVTVTGDTVIAGTLRSSDGRVRLDAMGSLVVNGRIVSGNGTDDAGSADTPLADQPFAVLLLVGDQGATFGNGSSVQSIGPVVVTDDPSVLNRTPQELFDEVEDAASDDLPTLAPLPPENEVFNTNPSFAPGPRLMIADAPVFPVIVRGTWPAPGDPMPAGDAPVVIFRFDGPRPLIIENYTVNAPPAPPGAPSDRSADPGENAAGGNGRRGMRLNIWNNGGPIDIRGTVTLNLADGGDGGSATSVCASASGGDGATSGNFRMTASGGISLTEGALIVHPGRAGHGGAATVTKGDPGADGCPGAAGSSATATGGKGGDNRKQLFVRGNVSGIGNLTIGDVEAGGGGNATAAACDGGNGIDCCDGGPGGEAVATGGHGGRASLNVSGFPVTVGVALGGFGGNATATGGDGGNGGDCKFSDAGDGGAGGDATATAGNGGDATNATGLSSGGNSGPATATGGNGGDGGDSGFGSPGGNGGGGTAIANPGTPGDPGGIDPGTEANAGQDGDAGGQLPVTLYCMNFAFVQADADQQVEPGPQVGPVLSEDGLTEVGTMEIEFVDIPGTQYARGETPVPHIGLFSLAELEIKPATLELFDDVPGVIGGIRLAVLAAQGIDDQHPLIVQAVDAEGQLIGERVFEEVPTSDDPENPQFFDATFNVEESVAVFRIIVPNVPDAAFVTPFRVYLLDP